MKTPLSPVYLNDRPVDLKEAKPKVAQLVEALGEDPERVEVHWLDRPGQEDPLPLEQVIDRTATPTRPIHLASSRKEAKGREPPRYMHKTYEHLIGTRGFSEDLLRTHFTLYEGYVKHTNLCVELLQAGTLNPYVAGEVRRRLGWEFNGMRLHELYFDGLQSGGRELPRDSGLRQALAAQFGSFEEWWRQFQAIGTTRGIGWGVLQHDPVADRLVNTWINEHDAGALAGTDPILVLDLFEHAYMRDYGTERGGYLKAFADAIDWSACEARWRRSSQRPTPLP